MIFFESDKLFDSHCHLNSEAFDIDRGELVAEVMASDVDKVVDIGTDLKSSALAKNNAKAFSGTVFAAIGIDPQVAINGDENFDSSYWDHNFLEDQLSKLEEMIDKELVVAIGEIGMDDYWLKKQVKEGKITDTQRGQSLAAQERLFRGQLELAAAHKLPVSIHSREQEAECLKIVQEYDVQGIFHSFTGSYKVAKSVIDAGCALGVNGIATYKSANDLREIYKRLLGRVSADWSPGDFYNRGVYFETDAPYLTPAGAKGSRNRPVNVSTVFKQFVKLTKS